MVNNAMTSVTRENFQAGRFGSPYVASQQELRTIHTVPMQGALPIVPSQANLRFTQRPAAPSLAVRPALMNRTFAGRPAFVPQRTPFAEQRASVSRATAVETSPSFARTAPSSNDPWQRFGANRGANDVTGAPAYARPVTPAYARPVAPAYAQPQYNRQVAPAYDRPAAPAYNRQAAPAYSRPATSNYSRAGASSYSRPANARPAARPTHSNSEHHDR